VSEHTQAVPPPEPTQALPRGRRVVRRAGASVLILAALATGRVVSTAYDEDQQFSGPFLVPGTVGRAVDLRYADVTALDVQGSTVVKPQLGTNLTTTGVWLVVPLRIVLKGEPGEVRYAAVVDREGRTYLAKGTSRSQYEAGTSQPGLPRYAAVVVEVPKDAVEGARLRVALDALDTRRDDMADIDLGLTAADAAEWSGREDVITLPASGDTPPAPLTATGTDTGGGTT
jgi:hypothetical protein